MNSIKAKRDLTPEEMILEENRGLLKSYLNQLYIHKQRKAQLTRRLKEVNAELNEPIGGMKYKCTPRSETNLVGAGAASILYRIAEIEDRIALQKESIEISMLKIMDIMDFLSENSTERMILELRHIDCRSWKQIMQEVNLTRTPCNDYYNKGLEKLLTFKKVMTILSAYRKKYEEDAS